MYSYTISQWLLFFFIYCFLGWIWESSYVSVKNGVKNKKFTWINRGFMHGPFLPIYGCGAITVLLVTIPVKDHILSVFVLGMLAATVMEYVTGEAMERLFKVRYWDYSHLPLNINGHVCFFVSLGWGAFSIFMVDVIHVPIERLVLGIPGLVTELTAVGVTVVFVSDFTLAFNEAMDMRELLEKMSEGREKLLSLAEQSDLPERIRNLVISPERPKPVDAIMNFGKKVEESVENSAEVIADKFAGAKEKKEKMQDTFAKNVEALRLGKLTDLRRIREEVRLLEVDKFPKKEEVLAMLENQIRSVLSRSNRQFTRAAGHLKRNPGTISKKYAEALRELQKMMDEK